MTLTRDRKLEILTRTLANAIERYQAGETSAESMGLVIRGTLTALDLLELQTRGARVN